MRKWNVTSAMASVFVSALASTIMAQSRGGQSRQGQSNQAQYGQDEFGQDQSRGQQRQRAGQQSNGRRYYAQRVSGQTQGASYTDQQLASWLLVDNRGEIQLARLAEQNASCDDVKEFAKQMVDDHAKMVEQLQQFAGFGQRRTGRSADDEQESYDRGQDQQANASNRGLPQPGGLNFNRLKQQLGQQCATSAQRELQQKDGDEFDKCYIGMQLAMHMQMLDTLKVFSRYASPQLDEIIEQAEQTTQEHLEHAKHLIKQLEGADDDDSQASRTSGKSSKTSDKSSARGSSTSEREARRDRRSDEE